MSSKEMRKLIESVIVVEDSDETYRLSEIKDEIKHLMGEAREIVEHSGDQQAWARAKSYWYGHILTALDNESEYMGSSMVTMQDTIDEIGGVGTMEDAVAQVEDTMNEKGAPLEDAVLEVAERLDMDASDLMAAAREAMGEQR